MSRDNYGEGRGRYEQRRDIGEEPFERNNRPLYRDHHGDNQNRGGRFQRPGYNRFDSFERERGRGTSDRSGGRGSRFEPPGSGFSRNERPRDRYSETVTQEHSSSHRERGGRSQHPTNNGNSTQHFESKIPREPSRRESPPEEYGGSERERPCNPSTSRAPIIEEGEPSGMKRKRDDDNMSEKSDSQRPPMKRTNERQGKYEKQSFDNIRTRPSNLETKQGNVGQEVVLKTNHFRLVPNTNFKLTQYSISFTPDGTGVELWPGNMKKHFVFQHKDFFGGYLYDGGSSIYLSKKLAEEKSTKISKTRDGEEVVLNIKFIRCIDAIDDLAFQVLNLILRRGMQGLHLQLVGRNYYDASSPIDIRELRLQLWPGYITSIRQYEHDILLCTEISHKVMRLETCYDILVQSTHSGDFKTEFSHKMIGQTVLTAYNNKTYTVHDVDYDKTPRDTFDTRNGPKSYADYYLEKYRITIRNLDQPILVSKPKMKDIRGGRNELICLIPELCRCTGLSDEMRKDQRSMRELAKFTRLSPTNRMNSLQIFSNRFFEARDCREVVEKYGLKFDKNLVQIKGRNLGPQKIYFGEGHTVTNLSWENVFRDHKMFASIQMKRWVAIYPGRARRECEEFIRALLEVSRKMGFNMEDPHPCVLPSDRVGDYPRAITESTNLDPSFYFCIIPRNTADYYMAIKKATLLDLGIPSQVLVQRTMGKNKMSVATKIGIQMNAKMRGAPWLMKIPFSDLMIIGYDVSHDTKDKKKSYGALVASLDSRGSKYFSAVSSHKSGNELSDNLKINFIKALRAFQKENKKFPERIIFYRDGVGDGQIEYVLQHEIAQIEQQFRQYYELDKFPQFAFIIVNKRINTRLFTMNKCNPNAGTIVDDVITMPERYDFYLISTSEKQSTVSPTYYNVAKSNLQTPPSRIQELTFRLCHLYYNWNGPIRVPAVVQYAHKLAFLMGQFLHRDVHKNLENYLHFL